MVLPPQDGCLILDIYFQYSAPDQEMPQGKMKVKAKGGAPPAKKDKSKKTHGGIQKGGNNLKKGKFSIAPKKQVKFRKYFEGCPIHSQ